MLPTISRQAAAYDAMYHGKTLVLKVSGAEIKSDDFPVLVQDVQHLVSKGVRIVFTFGGGDQISEAYGKTRQKIGGVAVTDESVLSQGVLPAYQTILQKLTAEFPDAKVVDPKDVQCDIHPDPRYGLVGVPNSIALPNEKLSIVGFVGQKEDQQLNVNADDIARKIVELNRKQIEELIFLTNSGGVWDVNRHVVPLLTENGLDQIIQGTHPSIKADGGMLKKVQEARKAVEIVGKVVMTKTNGLRGEIENWMGSGTLSVDTHQMSTSPMRYNEGPILDTVLKEYEDQGIFKKRDAQETEEVKNHHRVLRIKDSPLGGASIIPRGDWLELAAVWAGTAGNGIGRMVYDSALEAAGNRRMFALSADPAAQGSFRNHPGFKEIGQLSHVVVSGDDLPAYLKSYDTSNRDPMLYLKKD